MRATPPPPAATTPLDLLEGGESGRGLADRDAAVRRSRVRERDAHEAEGHGNQRRCDSFAHMRFLLFSLDQAGPDTTAPPESTSVRITVPANPRRMTTTPLRRSPAAKPLLPTSGLIIHNGAPIQEKISRRARDDRVACVFILRSSSDIVVLRLPRRIRRRARRQPWMAKIDH
jgi:hypothetical protein